MNRVFILVAAAAFCYGWGRLDGIRLERGRGDAERLELAEKAAQKTSEVLVAEQRARMLALALEDQAVADPVVVSVCLSADRVRRLNLR